MLITVVEVDVDTEVLEVLNDVEVEKDVDELVDWLVEVELVLILLEVLEVDVVKDTEVEVLLELEVLDVDILLDVELDVDVVVPSRIILSPSS